MIRSRTVGQNATRSSSRALTSRSLSLDKDWVMIAGGGPAGHVLPALAVADQLTDEGCPNEAIAFIGSRHGIEARLVTTAGYRIVVLPGRGIQRALSVRNVLNIVGLGAAFVRAFALMIRQRPAIVFSVGGYASVPCSFAAVVLRVPLVLAESNAKAGLAIRSVARFAKVTATAFDATALPRAVVTGNPVRRAVLDLAKGYTDQTNCVDATVAAANYGHSTVRRTARRDLGVPADIQMISIFGGSLGARAVNAVVFELCERWRDRVLVIHHVLGERDFTIGQEFLQTFRSKFPEAVLDYRQIRYEDRMDLVYGASDLVVCRAGATSIADLSIVGMPAILIPLPSAAEDHQSANAVAVAREGAAVHLPQNELSADRLAVEIDALLNDSARWLAMSVAQHKRARPRAAHDIAALLHQFAARPCPSSSHAVLEGHGVEGDSSRSAAQS